MSEEMSKLWRRIWWCIRIRDTLTSGSIGRPLHIADRDCDVEMLEPDDMSNEGPLGNKETIYACQMARLSIICKRTSPKACLCVHHVLQLRITVSRIVGSRYAAVQSTSEGQKTQLENDLDNFRLQIPAALQYRGIDVKTGQGLWSAMLLMAYKYVF